jgi:phosphotransferase system HPr (HPr) family protein
VRTLKLPDALHARPANLFVRVASKFEARVEVRKGDCRADGKNILDVLALGAARGEEIVVAAHGADAEEALDHIVRLVERAFDADLVPEEGAAAVAGIAIGAAVVAAAAEGIEKETTSEGDFDLAEERARFEAAIAGAIADVESLVRVLGKHEADLFRPEIEILRAIGVRVRARIDAGERAESAVVAETSSDASDLLLDAKTRLLERLGGQGQRRAIEAALAAAAGTEVVLVAEELAPSLVASLPAHVAGIVVGIDLELANQKRGTGYTSHAAILARGRDIPLAFVAPHVTAAIAFGDLVVVDTTEGAARVWVSPSAALVDDARARREARALARAGHAALSIDHLGVRVRANVGSIHDDVPAGAEGIGLFRTELAFAGRSSAPTETEQLATIAAVARKASGAPVVVRLFDAGGDKPLAWLAPRAANDAKDARGIALLFAHEAVLRAQLRALVRAREGGADVRALLPLVRSARDVEEVRTRCEGALPVGAMIETPEAVADVDAIAAASDFVCIGTNDLTASALSVNRADASLMLDARVLKLVAKTIEGAHARGRAVTVCGEIAADDRGARILVGLGADALSVAPPLVGEVRKTLAAATLDDCKAIARESMEKPS